MNKRTILTHGSIILAIFLLGFGPLLVSLLASAFANINGCDLHEGFPNPCIVLGLDWGETLYAMWTLGWLTLASLPVAIVILVVYLGAMLVRWIKGRAKEKAAS